MVTLTAVPHPTEPEIALEMTGRTIPEMPHAGGLGLNGAHPMPAFRSGFYDEDANVGEHQSTYGPCIFAYRYTDEVDLEEVTVGIVAYGINGDGDYGLRVAGVTNETAAVPFMWTGYVHGMFLAFIDDVVGAGDQIELTFVRQQLGDFTGETAAPVALTATDETITLDVGYDILQANYHGMGPAIDSTVEAPVINVYFEIDTYVQPAGIEPLYNGKIIAVRVPLTGDPTLRGILWTDEENNPFGIHNHYGSLVHEGHQYTLRSSGGADDEELHLTVSESEPAWPTLPTYTNYTLAFDGLDLPPDPLGHDTPSSPWFITNICATDSGWLLSFNYDEGDTARQRFLLIDPGWTYFQELIVTAANSIAQGLIDQGTEAFPDNQTAMCVDSEGRFVLLGGTNEVPEFAYVVEAAGQDDDRRLRVWGFSLDGHDFYVLRVGELETLVYDLTTGQWAHWASPERENWRAHVGQNWVGMSATTLARGFGTDIVAGDDTTGTLWILDPTAGRDDNPIEGDAAFTRIVVGGVPLSSRDAAPCNAVQLTLSLGAPAMTGAEITLRTSDDFGHTYVSHGAVTTTAADFGQVVEWRSLGTMRQPGRLFEISDDGAAVRISRADMR